MSPPEAPTDGFGRFLDALRRHLRDGERAIAAVAYDPRRETAERGEILIGVGRWSAVPGSLGHAGACLNNKGITAVVPGSAFASVSDMLRTADAATLAILAPGFPAPQAPVEVLASCCLVVEDISPDSCLGLVFFLARVAGVPTAGLPLHWSEYGRRWEAGDTLTTGEPLRSWGALHNALAHAFFDRPKRGKEPAADSPGLALLNEQLAVGWRACLSYLVEAMLAGADPADLPPDLPIPEHQRARALLAQDEIDYRRMLPFATTLQLSVRMRQPGRRFLLLDALIMEVAEGAPSFFSKKPFARRDVEHTELKCGFTLMAIHQRGSEPGDDMSVSVDPVSGTTLRDLWLELERLEDDRWGDERPRNQPRSGIIGYRDDAAKRPKPGAPNEPWYDTFNNYSKDPFTDGSYTLIAAPRRLADHRPGSRLGWSDVVDALWRLYHPARDIVVEWDGTPQPLAACVGGVRRKAPGAGGKDAVKRVAVASWLARGAGATASSEDTTEPQAILRLTGTLYRFLAGSVSLPEDRQWVGVADLPEQEDFDVVPLSGGFAVIHRHGVLLFNDWRHTPLNIAALKAHIELAIKRWRDPSDYATRLAVLRAKVEGTAGEPSAKGVIDLVEELTALRLDAQKFSDDTEGSFAAEEERRFRETLETRWGIAGRLTDIPQAAKDLEESLRAYSEARSAFFSERITLYGFPLAVGLTMLAFACDRIPKDYKTGSNDAFPLDLTPAISWPVPWLWVGIGTYVLIMVIAYLVIRTGRRRRRQRRHGRTVV